MTSRLEKRLDYLRQLNAASAAEREVAANAAAQRTVISIPTGTLGKRTASPPSIEVAAGASDEPIVVEPILTKEGDRVRTRRATIVKQGDKILAIMKGRSHHFDVNSDIYDEDALLEQALVGASGARSDRGRGGLEPRAPLVDVLLEPLRGVAVELEELQAHAGPRARGRPGAATPRARSAAPRSRCRAR